MTRADDAQQEVFDFLADPGAHGGVPPIRIDTHGAAVFLAGPHVYKVKRAVRFPFMDFSTLEKRRRACEAEIAVNRLNAPQIYLGVVPIVRRDGALRLGGEGEVVEWAAHLRRFDEQATLDRLASRGPLGADLIDALARAIDAAHRRAPVRDGREATADLRRRLDETLAELAQRPDVWGAAALAAYAKDLTRAFTAAESLLQARGARGGARRCHGDLHLGNVFVADGTPVLFDAIEFDESLATSDVLYDLAFMLMDLCQKGRRADADLLLNRYLLAIEDMAPQLEGLAAMPLFLSLRAAIRAKVTLALSGLRPERPGLQASAQSYFAAAQDFLTPRGVWLIAVGGLSGTGKSTLGAALAPALGRAPGAVLLRSDVLRKAMFGAKETEKLPARAYSAEAATAVYAKLEDLAQRALTAGQSVVLDAAHLRPKERQAARALALKAGARFCGLWLEAPAKALIARVTSRTGDASDATADVVRAQLALDAGAIDWERLDARAPAAALAREALRRALGAPTIGSDVG